MRKKKICFVGLDNYPVLNKKKGYEYFGGESVQQTLLAKAFYDLGYEVTMVVKDYGQKQGEIIDNIKLWKTFKDKKGLPVIRFLYPRLTSIVSALKKADADIYYQSCAGMMTGVVAWFCKKYNRKFIFRLASDSDCVPGELLINIWRDRKLYEYGIQHADIIAAQGINQIELLKKHYGLKSDFINMAAELPKDENKNKRDIDILWVNNIRDCKRPFMVIELAALLPNFNITIIGGVVDGFDLLYKEMEDRSSTINNIDFLGAVPYHDVNDYFSRSKIFINTSDIEGFPNSFLQAWIRGVPVVSFFDPDNIISNKNLGYSPDNIESMAIYIKELLNDEIKISDISKRCKQFADDNYSSISVAKSYENIINKYFIQP